VDAIISAMTDDDGTASARVARIRRSCVLFAASLMIFVTSCSAHRASGSVVSLCYQLLGDGGTPSSVEPEIRLGEETISAAVASLAQDAADVSADAARAQSQGLGELSQDARNMSEAIRTYATDFPAQNPTVELADITRINVTDNAVSSDCSHVSE
jgi:hypothetical protein